VLFWDLLLNLIYIISFFLIPLVIAFRLEHLAFKKYRDFELFMDFMILIDICFTFVTSYYDDGIQIKDFKRIAIRYLTSFFVPDFLSCFPSIIVLESKGRPVAYYFKIFRFLQITRLFNSLGFGISKLKQFLMGVVNKITLDNIFSTSKTLLFLVMVIHVLACIWIGLGFNYHKIEKSWFEVEGFCVGQFGLNERCEEPVELDGIMQPPICAPLTYEACIFENASKVYFVSFYFVSTTTTTVGYGDIFGNNNGEKFYIMLLEFFGISIFSILLGNIKNLKT